MKMISKGIDVSQLNEARDRYVIPDWQRDGVWDAPRRQGVIDSILRGIKLPKFYFALNDTTGKFEVVDGQQRLASIKAFIDGKFSLSSSTIRELGLGKGKFQDLPPNLVQAVEKFTIEFDEITEATEEEKREFFQRLQQGVPLASRERLNAVHSGFRDYARALTQRPFFQTIVAFKDTRNAFFDVTSRTLAVGVNGLVTGFRFKEMLPLFERQSGFSPFSPVAENIHATFDFLERAFHGRTAALRDRSFVQSVITLASHLVASGNAEGQEDAFAKFITDFHDDRAKQHKLSPSAIDQSYALFNKTSRGNWLDAPKIRHTILLERMEERQPELRSLFATVPDDRHWVVNAPSDQIAYPAFIAGQMVMESRSDSINNIYARRGELDIPDWQRGQVWNKARKQMLIDSVLEGWKLPKLYFSQNGDKNEVVDGQQRLSALFAFIEGRLHLSPQTIRKFGLSGGRFADLPLHMSESFANFSLEYDQIFGASPAELKDLFQRLQYGMPLLGREKLNAVTSNLRDFSKTLSENPFFQTRLSFRNARHVFFDIAAKIVAVEVDGIGTKWNYDKLRDLFETHKNFSLQSASAQRINAAFDFLLRAFPEKTPFRDGFFVQALATLAIKVVATNKSDGLESAFGQFATQFHSEWQRHIKGDPNADQVFFLFGSRNVGDLQNVAGKGQEILLEKMRQMAPQLAAVFDDSATEASPVLSAGSKVADISNRPSDGLSVTPEEPLAPRPSAPATISVAEKRDVTVPAAPRKTAPVPVVRTQKRPTTKEPPTADLHEQNIIDTFVAHAKAHGMSTSPVKKAKEHTVCDVEGSTLQEVESVLIRHGWLTPSGLVLFSLRTGVKFSDAPVRQIAAMAATEVGNPTAPPSQVHEANTGIEARTNYAPGTTDGNGKAAPLRPKPVSADGIDAAVLLQFSYPKESRRDIQTDFANIQLDAGKPLSPPKFIPSEAQAIILSGVVKWLDKSYKGKKMEQKPKHTPKTNAEVSSHCGLAGSNIRTELQRLCVIEPGAEFQFTPSFIEQFNNAARRAELVVWAVGYQTFRKQRAQQMAASLGITGGSRPAEEAHP